ncbi:MAG: CoA transferase [Gammaproteobacteria bacterium]
MLNGGAARYRTYQTADGFHVALGAVEPKFWQAFCDAAGHPEWIARMDEPLPQTALQQEVAAFLLPRRWRNAMNGSMALTAVSIRCWSCRTR